MKRTSWKFWMSKIHPPLSMTPQESRHLLIKFKASFQRHLDREHPEVMCGNRSHVRKHMQSVLDNPLMGGDRKLSRPCNHFDGHVESLSQLRHLMKRPMDHFKHEVAAGTATAESAKMCLTAQLQLARASDKPLPLPSSGAASIVLNWMWLSDVRVESLSQDIGLVILLVAVLHVEGNENMMWRWIKLLQRIFNESSNPKPEWTYKTQSAILHCFLRHEITSASFSSAVDVFDRGVVEISKASTDTVNRILRPSGKFLMLQILNDSSLMSTAQLKSFIRTIPVWSPTPQLHRILLELYLPGRANIDAALKFLAEVDLDRFASIKQRIRRGDLVRLTLKVAELLLSSGLVQEVRWLMEFLQTHFAAEIGCSDPDASQLVRYTGQQQQSSEESSLRLLDSLAVH